MQVYFLSDEICRMGGLVSPLPCQATRTYLKACRKALRDSITISTPRVAQMKTNRAAKSRLEFRNRQTGLLQIGRS